jgi:hypothetical protein
MGNCWKPHHGAEQMISRLVRGAVAGGLETRDAWKTRWMQAAAVASRAMASREEDPYSVLGVRPGASTEEIKRAYKRKVRPIST